ncbi:hypothetical protein Ancab_028416, partial [Ancistrocladus abbreviatus]
TVGDFLQQEVTRLLGVEREVQNLGAKSRFDVARVLISTMVPGVISADVSVSVDGSSFLVNVVEEASSETTFSKGMERARVGETQQKRSGDCYLNWETKRFSSSRQCSLSASRCGERPLSPEKNRAIGKGAFQKRRTATVTGLVNRAGMDRDYERGQLGCTLGKIRRWEPGYVSPPRENSVGVLIEEGTTPLRRSEESELADSRSDTVMEGGEPGPLCPRPTAEFDQSRIGH